MSNDGGRHAHGEPTRAQLALRNAAKTLRDQPEPEPPAPPHTPEPPPQRPPRRREHHHRLLEVDELFVGRPTLGAVFAYRDAAGNTLADVDVLHTPEHSKIGALLAGESSRHVDERWVVAVDGEPVFFVEQYRATGRSSYGVFGPGGEPLGTYVSDGGVLHHNVEVREASSAPVASIRVHHHRHVITHASGVELGYCWRAFSAIGNDEDDEVWGLRLEADGDLLDRRALVAAPLVCHLMAFPKRHLDGGGEIGILLLETLPPVGLVVVGVERTIDGLYWLRRRLD